MRPCDGCAIRVGDFVLSTGGKDCGTVYLVTEANAGTPGYFRVTDGRHRPLEAQKRKNGKHLLPLNVDGTPSDFGTTISNRKVRVAIRAAIDVCINNNIE